MEDSSTSPVFVNSGCIPNSRDSHEKIKSRVERTTKHGLEDLSSHSIFLSDKSFDDLKSLHFFSCKMQVLYLSYKIIIEMSEILEVEGF